MSDQETVRIVINIGGYSNEMQAKQEARDFSRPEVFSNRSAFFPNPVNNVNIDPFSYFNNNLAGTLAHDIPGNPFPGK